MLSVQFHRLNYSTNHAFHEQRGSLVDSAEDGDFSVGVEEFGDRVLVVEYSFAVDYRRKSQDLDRHTGGIFVFLFEVDVLQKILKTKFKIKTCLRYCF